MMKDCPIVGIDRRPDDKRYELLFFFWGGRWFKGDPSAVGPF